MKKKLLIIGVNGFIGSHCADYFDNIKKYEVTGCDISDDSIIKNYIKIDSINPDFNNVFKKTEFDICINCSGAANVSQSLKDPLRDFQLNTINVFQILNAIKHYQPKCEFINLSSAAVYGDPKFIPVAESCELKPVSPYGFHKMMSEQICEEFHRFWNLKTLSLRIFSVYGPGLRKQILWDISRKIKTNPKEIQLFGTGNETRDFIFISDLVWLLEIIIDKASFNGEVINVGNGTQISIREIAEILGSEINPNIAIIFNEQKREGDPINWEADITTIYEMGYNSKIDIKEGIKFYIQWLKENELL